MGLFDRHRRGDRALQPDVLLAALIDSLEQKDFTRLMRLINGNDGTIREHFRAWAKVPTELRGDAAAVQRYANTLMFLARAYEKVGDATLIDWLMGRGRAVPQLGDDLQRAQKLVDSGDAAGAIPILRELRESLRGAVGSGVGHYLPRILGSLGVALAATGDKTEAMSVTREALELCRQAGDDEGVQAYTRNLKLLETHVGGLGGSNLVIVFTDERGQTLAPEELVSATGKITWEVRSLTSLNRDADRLHRDGRAAGARGDYDAAVNLFTEAAKIDPTWPYPIFDRAFTHLLKEDFENALIDYRRVLELSPRGFFITREAIDMLTREAAGEFPTGLYAAFVTLEHMPEQQRRAILAQLVEKYPSHAPAWDDHVNFIADRSERVDAIDKGLAAQPDVDTRGSLLVKKALALSALGARDRALEMLRPLSAGAGDSMSTYAMALVAVAKITRQNSREEGDQNARPE